MTESTSVAAAPKRFTDLLQDMMPQFKASLPAHLKQNAERYMRVALTEYRRSDQLQQCNPYSVLAAAMVATGLGLEVGPGGRAYLVPYKGECTFVPGWKGLVELANRSGRSSCWTGVIYDGQHFEYQQGDQPFLRITDDVDDTDPDKIAFTYAIGRITGSEWPVIERWSIKKVHLHLERFNKVGGKHYAYNHFEMYARKVPLLQVLKYMPFSPELEAAQILDARAEQGRGLTIESAADALEGVFEKLDEPPSKPPQETKDKERTPSGRKRPAAKKDGSQQPPQAEEPGKPAGPEDLAFIRKKVAAMDAMSEVDICGAFKIGKLEELRANQVNSVLQWLSDPSKKLGT